MSVALNLPGWGASTIERRRIAKTIMEASLRAFFARANLVTVFAPVPLVAKPPQLGHKG